MKQLLILVACICLSFFANAGDYVTVTGSGKTFDEAKQQAFRKAIEFKVGATVLSDIETQNYRRVKDEIYIYSSGYVDNYKILKREDTDTGVTVLADVSVAESKLKNRILSGASSSKEFDGERHSAQVSTYIQERQQGDRLLGKLLSDYPRKAFDIQQYPHSILLDEYRNTAINIPYKLSWNYEFLKSLQESLSLLQDCTPGYFQKCNSTIKVLNRKSGDFFASPSEHGFNDLGTLYKIHDDGYPKIVVRLFDVYGNLLYGSCYPTQYVTGPRASQNNMTVFGLDKEEGTIVISQVPLNIIDRTRKIVLTIEPQNICTKS